jgi:gliding motility-associated-like protein
VGVYPIPHADFNYAPYIPIENVSDVYFTDASYGATVTSWNWYFMSNATYQSTKQNPVFLYTEAGNYAITLVAKSDKGCIDTVTKTILVSEDFGVFVPNAFTPNDDGLNDVFFAKGFGITAFQMQIFDRWGEKIFQSHDINDAWDGTYQLRGSKMIQEGVYTWRITLTNVFGKSKEITGHVTLIK